MLNTAKKSLEKEVILAAREYGINMTLFRNVLGAKLGVNVTDMECLELLFFKGIATPTELGQYTGLSSGATTAMLDRLEKAKFIMREPNPHDRRGVCITITKNSAKSVGALFAGTRATQDALVASYSGQELEAIADFLKQLTAICENSREKLLEQPETPANS